MRRLITLTAAALVAACALPAAAQDSMEPAKMDPAKKVQPVDVGSLSVGNPAPALTVEKWLKGSAVPSFEKGHVYVVEFWATWCGPCIASMPHLTELQKQYKDKNVTIIGVSTKDRRGNTIDKAEDMVAKKADVMGYTVAWDKDGATNSAYMKAAGQRYIPCSFVVDQKGIVTYIGSPSVLDYVLEKTVAGTWDAKTDPKQLEELVAKVDSLDEKIGEDPKAAAKILKELDEKYPFITKDMDGQRFALAVSLGDNAQASKLAGKLVDRMTAEKDAENLNQFAWTMVDPEGSPKFKDIDLAMKAAQKGVEITVEKNPAIVDTLARCYWVKGDRLNAIKWQKKAVAVVAGSEEFKDNPGMKEELESTLRDYEKGSN